MEEFGRIWKNFKPVQAKIDFFLLNTEIVCGEEILVAVTLVGFLQICVESPPNFKILHKNNSIVI